jgi:hypothetical protein
VPEHRWRDACASVAAMKFHLARCSEVVRSGTRAMSSDPLQSERVRRRRGESEEERAVHVSRVVTPGSIA